MNYKTILIRSPNWIGDQVLAFPFFFHLRKAFPSSRIVSVCVPWVQAVQFKKQVDEVFVLPVPLKRGLRAKWDSFEAGARMLREVGPWDLGISLPHSFSAAWLFYRAGVRRRRGVAADGRSFLLHERVPLPESNENREIVHRSQAYLKLLPGGSEELGSATDFWEVPEGEGLGLDGIGVSGGVLDRFDAELEWPDAEVDSPNLSLPSSPYWVLAPGAQAESRRWPVERFAALARNIADHTGWKGLIVGGAGESTLASQLAQDPSLRLSNWTGRGTVASYWKVFRNARFSVCNDSGLAHVASLCGSPVQVIWGAGVPKRTRPIGPGLTQVTINPVECWPCERNSCTQLEQKKLECLRGIYPNDVWNEIKSGFRLG